ncbi:MAG: hypothetical protein J4F36_10060 [Nitrosopumilaceae archaeon]|nr:hypothetical protein [Nitrosopumilaceae archaeon]
MTTKNIKIALFASLIVALILPFSVMGVVDAAPSENANDQAKENVSKDAFTEAVKQVHEMRSEKLSLQQQNLDEEILAETKIKNERTIEALDAQISEKMKILNDYENQRKALYYIEPAREQYILSVVSELRDEVKAFAKSVDMHSYGVNINYLEKGITISTSDASYDDTLRKIIEKYPTDIQINIKHGMAADYSCNSRVADCNPIVGGIQSESNGAAGPCTLGLPVMRGTAVGFIAAGHCIEDNEQLHQPVDGWFNQIGNSADSRYESTCDCAYATKTTGTSSHSWVLRDPNTYLTITSEGTARPAQGTQVVMFAVVSDFQQGEVINPNSQYTYNGVDWDLVELDIVATNGDSGAPITNAAGSQMLGIMKGENVDTHNPVMTPWNEIDTRFGLSLQS